MEDVARGEEQQFVRSLKRIEVNSDIVLDNFCKRKKDTGTES